MDVVAEQIDEGRSGSPVKVRRRLAAGSEVSPVERLFLAVEKVKPSSLLLQTPNVSDMVNTLRNIPPTRYVHLGLCVGAMEKLEDVVASFEPGSAKLLTDVDNAARVTFKVAAPFHGLTAFGPARALADFVDSNAKTITKFNSVLTLS